MTLPPPPDPRRTLLATGSKPWLAGLVGVLVVGAGVMCGWYVVNLAVKAEDRLPAMGAAMYLQVPFLVAAVLAFALLRRPTVRRAVLVMLAVAIGLGATFLLVRPQAPTGNNHAEDVSEGGRNATADAAIWLEAALPGRWTMEEPSTPSTCRDWLGRDRGSANSEVTVHVRADLDLDDLDRLAGELSHRGWDVEFFANNFGGSTGRNIKAARDGYHVTTETAFDDPNLRYPTTHLSIWTPCLRRN